MHRSEIKSLIKLKDLTSTFRDYNNYILSL